MRIIELIHLRLLFPRNPRRRECRTSPTASPHGSTSASASTSTTPSPTGCSPAPWYWGSWKRSGTNATKESELGKTEYCWSGGHCLGKGMGYFFFWRSNVNSVKLSVFHCLEFHLKPFHIYIFYFFFKAFHVTNIVMALENRLAICFFLFFLDQDKHFGAPNEKNMLKNTRFSSKSYKRRNELSTPRSKRQKRRLEYAC